MEHSIDLLKILLVEDDPMIAEIYQKKLSVSGFQVMTASHSSEVFSKVAKEKFDLVIMDLVLPEMNGIEILRELRKNGKYDPALKVVIFSNLDDAENQHAAMDLGVIRFLSKSQYNPSQLVEEIHRIFRESVEQKKNHIRIEQQKSGAIEDGEISKKKTVLYMEDEDVFVELFGERLSVDGFNLIHAKNGIEGLRIIEEKNIDAVITDIAMPGMRGLEIIEHIRSNEKTRHIPIIVCSASATAEEEVRFQELGIQGYYVKTKITPSELVEKIREITKDL